MEFRKLSAKYYDFSEIGEYLMRLKEWKREQQGEYVSASEKEAQSTTQRASGNLSI